MTDGGFEFPKAAMFDFDGTITEQGKHIPAPGVVRAIIELAQRIPVAFCTGRQLESFVDHGIRQFFRELDEPGYPDEARKNFLKNLFFIAENGSLGYYFDLEKADFVEFYRCSWPDEFITKELLRDLLSPIVAEFGEVMDLHRTIVVVRTHFSTALKIQTVDYEKIRGLSDDIYRAVKEFLQKFAVEKYRNDANFEDFLHLGNSGIGVVICSAKGDKDNGIKEFAEYLRRERGLRIGPSAREILVVGDRPDKAGNDHYFLKGLLGTPYTVGYFDESLPYPLPVINSEGERLLHARGTEWLVRRLLLS